MGNPVIRPEDVKTLFETRFIKLFDLQYEEGKHYFDATRRNADKIVAIKSDEEFRTMIPDAVSCVVVLSPENEEPRLVLSYEYRYPAGRFLLSIPAGLIDPDDQNENQPALVAAKREISEETGIKVNDQDELFLLSPFLFSTPGMTDESNAIACAVIRHSTIGEFSQIGAVGTELFKGFELVTKEQAREILQNGRDKNGFFYSVYTWAALMSFVHDEWKRS